VWTKALSKSIDRLNQRLNESNERLLIFCHFYKREFGLLTLKAPSELKAALKKLYQPAFHDDESGIESMAFNRDDSFRIKLNLDALKQVVFAINEI
jgi:hypothetical protein